MLTNNYRVFSPSKVMQVDKFRETNIYSINNSYRLCITICFVLCVCKWFIYFSVFSILPKRLKNACRARLVLLVRLLISLLKVARFI